jgi:hypothetical protein
MAISKARRFSKLISTSGVKGSTSELTENLEDVIGDMVTNNTVTGPLTVSYNDVTGKINFDASEASAIAIANATAMSIVFGG